MNTKKAIRIGGYETLLSVMAIIMVIAINLFVSALPVQYTNFDTSYQKLYTISPQTKEVISSLEEDVVLYYLALQGRYDVAIQDMLRRYASLSDRIRVEYVDPLVYPNFASQFTSESLVGNDIIVKIGDRSRLVAYKDIYDIIFNASYTSSDIKYDMVFQGESSLTNAISYLTKGNMPVVYNLIGHGETPIGPDLVRFVERQNIVIKDLALISGGAPEDAQCLIMVSPRSDISSEELELTRDYLAGGGNLLLITDYVVTDFPNLDELLDGYGLYKANGLIIEPSAGYRMSGYPINLVPQIHEHEITTPLIKANSVLLFPVCHGIKIKDAYQDTLTVAPLLSTSPYAYLKENAINKEVLSLAKEDEDITAEYIIGAVARERYAGAESKLVWFSTSEFLKDNYDSVAAGANRDLFVNAIAWMTDHEDAINIHAKTISTKYLSLNNSQAAFLAILFIGAIPLAFAGAGGFIWYRRKAS